MADEIIKGADTADTTDTTDNTTVTTDTPQTETVDVQAQAQKIADAMVAKKLKAMPTKDELKAFKDWQEAQKTPEQKENEELLKLKQEAESYKAKAMAYENEKTVIKSGVSTDFAEFVAYQAGKSVTDEVDFGTALKAYLVANPQYTKEQTQPFKSGLPQGQGQTKVGGVEEAFLKKNPNLKI